MGNKRLPDVAALVGTPLCGGREHYSKEVRKIDNGYITRESHDDGLGYRSMETYTPHHPDTSDSVGGTANAMAKAVNFMKKC